MALKKRRRKKPLDRSRNSTSANISLEYINNKRRVTDFVWFDKGIYTQPPASWARTSAHDMSRPWASNQQARMVRHCAKVQGVGSTPSRPEDATGSGLLIYSRSSTTISVCGTKFWPGHLIGDQTRPSMGKLCLILYYSVPAAR